MVDSFRNWAILWGMAAAMSAGGWPALADDPPARNQDNVKDKPKAPRTLDDPPTPFVPLHPRTVADQNRVEALRLYAAARALEDQFQIGGGPRGDDFRKPIDDAIGLLEKAEKLDPESVTILRRLSKLHFVIGKTDAAVAYARKLLDLDPGDSGTVSLLVTHYLERKGDPAAAEKLLQKVAANPKLGKTSPGYLVVQRSLGDLYAEFLNQPEKAADAYGKLMDALEDKAAAQLSAVDQKRILEGDEAASYLKFGETFLQAKKTDLAIRAFRKGLLYRADHPTLPRNLAEALLRSGKAQESLQIVEAFLKRQPGGAESYELLVEILAALKRDDQILARLIEAAAADPNNFRLQLLLSERYRAEGQVAKADAVLQAVKANLAEPQLYAALAASYLKARRAEDLVKLLGEAIEKPNGADFVKVQVEALSNDNDLLDKCLDAGVKLQTANPPELGEGARRLLTFLARKSRKLDKLLQIDRLILAQVPTSTNYKEMLTDMELAEKYDEAAAVARAMFEKFPAQRTAEALLELAQVLSRGGKPAAALETAREAEKLDPQNPDVLFPLGFYLTQAGKEDDAIALYQGLLRQFGDNEKISLFAQKGICNCHLSKGDDAKYEAELEGIFRKYPDDIGVNNDLGYFWAERGKNLDRAEAMIRKALEEEPTQSAYLDSLGWVLFKRGKAKEAIEPLEKAVGARADATICEHLGDVLFQLREYARARDYYKKAEGYATKAVPPDKRLGEIRKKLSDLDKLGPAPAPKGAGDAERP